MRNNSFFPYLKKQHKGRDKGYIYRQTFAAFVQLYFLFFYIFMYTSFWLPNLHSDTVSANHEEFEKSKFTKNRSEYYHCPYFYQIDFLHRPSISKKQTSYIFEQHINDTSNIQRTTFANNNLSEDPEKKIYRYW